MCKTIMHIIICFYVLWPSQVAYLIEKQVLSYTS